MLQGHRALQRSSFVAHEAKHFRRQGPLGRPPDTPLGGVNDNGATGGVQNTGVDSPPTPTPTPNVPAAPTSDSTVHRTTVTTVVAAPPTTAPSSSSTPTTISTSSTTTSSSSSSLSTSSTPLTPTLKSTTSPLPLSTPAKTNTIFQTTFASTSALPSTTADGASASSTSDSSSSGISTAGIIGIAAAGIVGIAVVTGLIMFFIRRLRKGNEYDVDNLRRQSVVLGDEAASLHRGNSDGYSARPRPPTMIERHYANIAPSGPVNAFGGIRPGEVMPSSGLAPSFPPASQFQQTYYAGSMGQTPVGSPVSIAPYGSAVDNQGRIVRTPSTSATSTLSRGKSIRDPFNDPQPSQEGADYTDLSRASVTPFQAAQYAAISRELNIPPPVPTIPPSVDLDKSTFSPDSALDSPFSDPRGQGLRDQTGPSVDDNGLQPSRASSEFQHHTFGTYADDSRVASLPPMLSPQQSANMMSPQEEMNFPVSPSPLRSEFNISSTNVSALPSPVITAFTGQGPNVSTGSPLRYAVGAGDDNTSQSSSSNQPSKRPHSTYEDEDAYGGF